MKTDEQLLTQIATLESQLGSHRAFHEGRCPIRLRINNLRWIIKNRTFVPPGVAHARRSAAAKQRWALEKQRVAARLVPFLLVVTRQYVKAKAQEAAADKRRAELAAARNREKALLYYRFNREKINAARGCPLDQYFRRASSRGEKKRLERKNDLFRAVQGLEERLGNRVHIRLLRILRRRLNVAFKAGRDFSKTARELLGCEVPFLRKYLEALWTPGMTWETYGFYGWHIDHIIPCAKFNLQDPEEQKKCFHFSNLQPLWMKDNFDKRDS